jgi:UDP-3-O-acyl-N-acetylglucosamine deacetylase
MAPQQRTLRKEIKLTGRPYQTGKRCTVTIRPAKEETGIVFVRGKRRARADLENAVARKALRNAVFGFNTVRIKDRNGKTVVNSPEHLLSALHVTGIDNAEVGVSRSSLPFFEGSVEPWIRGIENAGIEKQKVARRNIKLRMPDQGGLVRSGSFVNRRLAKRKVKLEGITFKGTEKLVFIEGSKGDMIILRPKTGEPRLTYYFEYPHKAFRGPQTYSLKMGDLEGFKKDVMRARTPGFPGGRFGRLVMELGRIGVGDWRLHGMTYEKLLATGGKGRKGFLNPPGTWVRYGGQEPVRHKIIDALGELALLGRPQGMEVFFIKTGHDFSVRNLKRLVEEGILVRE